MVVASLQVTLVSSTGDELGLHILLDLLPEDDKIVKVGHVAGILGLGLVLND